MNIVLYKSVTGNTKKYATMIAEELNCQATELKYANKKLVQDMDTIIYGGPVHAGNFSGLKKARKLARGKKLIAFACGGDIGRESEVQKVKDKSVRPDDTNLSFYYVPGGMDMRKLTGILKFMLNIVYKMISKKKEKTEDDIEFLKGFDEPQDYVDKKHVMDLLSEVKEAN